MLPQHRFDMAKRNKTRREYKKIYNARTAKKFQYLRSKAAEHMLKAVQVLEQTRFTKYDLPHLKHSRSSRLPFLRETVWRLSSGRPTFRNVKNIALERVQHDVVKRLSIVYDLHICKHGLPSEEIFPNKLYSWDLGDFFKRRKLDTVWVDVLKVQIDKECFSTRKFKTDLEELRRYLRIIFTFHRKRHEDETLKEDLFRYFEETVSLLDYEDNFYNELKANKKKLTDMSTHFLNATNNPHRSRKNFMYKLYLEERFMNADVFDPIEKRYQKRFYANREKEFESKCETAEEKIEDQIQHYKRLFELETFSSAWLLTYYNNEIESFKSRTQMLSTTYDVEFEKVDNQIIYYKINLDKIKEQRKFLLEQLNRFREELEQLREKEMAERAEILAARERKRALSEANRLAKAQKKARLAAKKAKAKRR